ncbi:hypothetical protein KTC61_21180, partial [Klebsiella pneumoniae]|nr:hypothetical protein [Klebsiella pneumoniae]
MVIFRKLTCVVTFIVSSMNSSIAGMKDISRLRCVVRQKSTGVRRLWAARDALSNILLRQNAMEGANKQVISSQADSLIKISRIWA